MKDVKWKRGEGMARTGGIRGLGSDEAVWTKLILPLFKIYTAIFQTWRFLSSFIIIRSPGISEKSASITLKQSNMYSACLTTSPSWPEVRFNRRHLTFSPFSPIYSPEWAILYLTSTLLYWSCSTYSIRLFQFWLQKHCVDIKNMACFPPLVAAFGRELGQATVKKLQTLLPQRLYNIFFSSMYCSYVIYWNRTWKHELRHLLF